MQSCLYEGRLRHRRFSPGSHGFEYRLFMVYVDLAELDTAFEAHPLWSSRGWNVASLSREDHLGDPTSALDTSVRDLVETRTGCRPQGSIRLLTHFRYLGYSFNPVSFYYCFDKQDQLEAVVAEVNNTPWGEQHVYILTSDLNIGSPERPRYAFGKSFHVSPFLSMNQDYVWSFKKPCRSLSVHTENYEQGDRCFDVTMTMARSEITGWSLSRVLFQYPAMTVQVIASIYWQALKLWCKRMPFYDHPASAAKGT